MPHLMSRILRSALAALLFVVLGTGLGLRPRASRPNSLTVTRADGTSQNFTVELAVSAEQRAQGLMNRREMAADQGMLFDFGTTRRVYMWMKNTYLPLDMLFLHPDGTIAHIASGKPLSEEIIDSRAPVRFVLELNAGTASTLGIAVGDRVESPQIAASSPKP
ncbi:MAG: DUF192 domain-containing protein [Rhizobium sp.]|nr:DUF192 domain-containing protein [Rhizobium sp.]